MKGSTLKKEHLKKLAKEAKLMNKYKGLNRSNLISIILGGVIILLMIVWLISIFGLAFSYWLFTNGHYIWASLIVIVDLLVLRSYLKTKV